MTLDPVLIQHWQQLHTLDHDDLEWIEEHADPGDPHPILSAVEALRAWFVEV